MLHFQNNKYKRLTSHHFPQNTVNAAALGSRTGYILIEIREHNEKFHQLPGVDKRLQRSIKNEVMSLVQSFGECDTTCQAQAAGR